MANTLSLRRRIKTAQNVSKTTRAMQMIAASKLKRAQQQALASRPYVTSLMAITKNIAPKTKATQKELHPYLQTHITTGKTLFVIISPDKGLCGGLVTNLVREFIKLKTSSNAFFLTVGKKIEGPVAGSKNLIASFPFGNTLPSYEAVLPIIKIIDEYFLGGKVDNVSIITTHFNSLFSQTPKHTPLLPVLFEKKGDEKISDMFFEPSKEKLLPTLLKRYLEMVIYQQMLESYLSEQASRMIAMQNATNNAKDIVNTLKLLYNKARQEKITNEILDISSATIAMEIER